MELNDESKLPENVVDPPEVQRKGYRGKLRFGDRFELSYKNHVTGLVLPKLIIGRHSPNIL